MSNNNPKISVIIPAYNIAEYLPRCLDSVLGQTYQNLEVIVVSDGSTDDTDRVIKDYAEKDSRIVPVFKSNSGVSGTRNAGLDIATGDYIGFVDGDDFIELNMYEVLMNNALKYDADISHCGYQMVFPSRVDYYYNTKELRVQEGKQGLIDFLIGEKIEPGIWNKLYRREIISEIRMDTNIQYNEDVLFNFLAFKNAKKAIYEDIPFYHYILRKTSATGVSNLGDNQKTVVDVMYVAKRMLGLSDESIKPYSGKRYLECLITTYRAVMKSEKTFKQKQAKFIRSELKKYKEYVVYLSKAKKTEKILIERLPVLYRMMFSIYYRFFCKTKNKYEVK